MEPFKHCSNQKIRKLLARSYLHEGRFRDAVMLYLEILNDCPQDIDAYMVLGNLYLAAGSPLTAQALYQQVLDHNPANMLALKQLDKAASRPGCGWEEKEPLHLEAAARLYARLEATFSGDRLTEITAAVDLVEKVPAEWSDTGQLLMPALIELNIRQARVEGYAEIADSLRSLQFNLSRRLSSRWEEDAPTASGPVDP